MKAEKSKVLVCEENGTEPEIWLCCKRLERNQNVEYLGSILTVHEG